MQDFFVFVAGANDPYHALAVWCYVNFHGDMMPVILLDERMYEKSYWVIRTNSELYIAIAVEILNFVP